ncbi:PepSY-like domain-containing protein [Bacteroides sp. 519]|uniref:PepSY-like domain-containing protein n=1 Tax=Bacteroides sp. 519 TaxID=2302937 RepID=UPI0013D28825|nr:PepSY-like domain-containing protein [Bacteroides sp. 519]NDV58127.1 ribosome biogenesis protein [Bacteroides sp. 519]
MKELKFLALALLATTLFVFTSCSDDDDLKPDQIFTEALSAKFPDAKAIEWERAKAYYVADCYVGNKDLDVWFDGAAKWIMTETELLKTDLPTAVLTALEASEYSTWRVDDVDMLEYPSKATRYVIEVEQGNKEMDLYFSVDGELIEEKDVTNTDDTHWPE